MTQTHLSLASRSWDRLQKIKGGADISVDGGNLDIGTVVAVAYHGCTPKLSSDPAVLERINKSLTVLADHLEKGHSVYGVNTGFGGSADSRTDRAAALQEALLQLTQAGILTTADKNSNIPSTLGSHSIPAPWVRASIVVRCNSNARGHSAVSLPILQSLLGLIENRIIPIIPLRGSISASGDLMPLSYIAGVIEGNPDISVQMYEKDPFMPPRIMTARDALAAAGMERRQLGPKEGLGLINGTSTSAALASLVLYETHQLAILTQALSAMGIEAIRGTAESFHPFISATRPHDGQAECAQNIFSLLQGSNLALGLDTGKERKKTGLVQDRYAWRSAPQWIGPQLEDLSLADKQVSVELNSTCDNPLVDTDNKEIYCGANFQAASITSAMEKTRLALQMFGKMLFAQATEIIDPNYNNGLPTNLVADDPNVSFTMKGVDISMAAYMSELAYVANPVSSHVQTAEMRNQAVNSLAFISGRYTMQAVELVSMMCACSLYINCQALDLRTVHVTFLENLTPHLEFVTAKAFKTLTDKEVIALNDALSAHVAATWPKTTRVAIPQRCKQTIKSAVTVVCDAVSTASSSVTIPSIKIWEAEAIQTMERVYDETAAAFFQKQHTPELLGVGAKTLYRAIREELKIPFHLGFVDRPTAESDVGRVKKTVGSWISIIYEALRNGQLHGPIMRMMADL